MMSSIFAISYGALWILMCILYFAVLLLYRHFGRQVLKERQQLESVGPKVNDQVSVRLETVDGMSVEIGKGAGRHVVMFAAPGCKACEAIQPQVREAVTSGGLQGRDFVVVYHGDRKRTTAYAGAIASRILAVSDPGRELARLWTVPWTPFFVATGPEGVVRWKGASLRELKAAVKAARVSNAGSDSPDGTLLQESKVAAVAKNTSD